jgi:ribosomal protein L37E
VGERKHFEERIMGHRDHEIIHHIPCPRCGKHVQVTPDGKCVCEPCKAKREQEKKAERKR